MVHIILQGSYGDFLIPWSFRQRVCNEISSDDAAEFAESEEL